VGAVMSPVKNSPIFAMIRRIVGSILPAVRYFQRGPRTCRSSVMTSGGAWIICST
jgi:hypothetical protein